jgi:hypothetical protein
MAPNVGTENMFLIIFLPRGGMRVRGEGVKYLGWGHMRESGAQGEYSVMTRRRMIGAAATLAGLSTAFGMQSEAAREMKMVPAKSANANVRRYVRKSICRPSRIALSPVA